MTTTAATFSLILLNGGVGARVGAGQPKQLLKLRGIPILVYTLITADRLSQVGQIVVNFPEGWQQEIQEVLDAYAISTPITLVPGAPTRHSSVREMLPHCEYDQVLLHESARPLATAADFTRLIDSPFENVALMSPIPFTVAPVDPETHRVTGSLDRARLRNVQLPQKFRRSDLVAAHEKALAEGFEYTEDATLVADAGFPVHFLDGNDTNLKVTSPTDVRMATVLLQGERERDV
ncbi:IspD/TarI family cytidylyltransferase [Brachybacterium paraconglomeratum]|uniref:IspD/TarI family cytidylyltransferase n=1 Tax=Brachybacterium paraconglomeratum TaxID=173362 RepID=UPI0031EF8298